MLHDVYEAETIRCNFAAVTLPPDSERDDCHVPRDSEWAGFSAEMAAILEEMAL